MPEASNKAAMNPIDNIYRKYNHSQSRCYVVVLNVTQKGYLRIEHKLPSFVKQLTGLFLSTSMMDGISCAGIISLNFNGDAFKSVQLPVYKTIKLEGDMRPLPMNESIKPNSFLQGYYIDMSETSTFPYKVSIYLHYTPVP